MKNMHTQIDEITNKFTQSFGELSTKQLNWKPNSDTWSIAQNIDHIIVLNKTYFTVIDSLRKDTCKLPFISKIGFVVSFFGNAILKTVQPDRKKKIKTFPIWEPTKSEISEGILDRFNKHQLELKKLLESSTDLVNRGVIISSPANKNIVYKLEKAFEIIVTHELRHFKQAKEILQLMKKETKH